MALLGAPLHYSEAQLQKIMSPRHFVEVRKTLGGPSPEVTRAALAESRGLLEQHRAAWLARRAALDAAEATRRREVDAL